MEVGGIWFRGKLNALRIRPTSLIICSRHFDWILGFGAIQINTKRLDFWLPKFVELVFLREADKRGMLHAFPSSVRHLERKDRLSNAVERTLGVRELLTHTSVIAIRMKNEGLVEEELVYSSQFCYWGIPLPECPNCGNHNVRAVTSQRHVKKEKKTKKKRDLVTVRCHGCNSRTKGTGVGCPSGVRPVGRSDGERARYFWKPLRLPSPWSSHEWKS
jgi:hypothetical protein